MKCTIAKKGVDIRGGGETLQWLSAKMTPKKHLTRIEDLTAINAKGDLKIIHQGSAGVSGRYRLGQWKLAEGSGG